MSGLQRATYNFNTIGPWDNPLNAGMGGSSAQIGFGDPQATLIDAIFNSPGAYKGLEPAINFDQRDVQFGYTGGGRTVVSGGLASGTNPFIDALSRIGNLMGGNIPGAISGNSTQESIEGVKNFGKYALIIALAFILLIIGLVAIVGTSNIRAVVESTARAAA